MIEPINVAELPPAMVPLPEPTEAAKTGAEVLLRTLVTPVDDKGPAVRILDEELARYLTACSMDAAMGNI